MNSVCKRVVLAAVALTLAAPACAATNLVVNGDFTVPGTGGGWASLASIPGWFSENGDTIEIGNAAVYGATCVSAGCQLLEVNANRFGSISQIVTGLTPGARYDFSWSMAGRNDGGPQQLQVSVDGAIVGQLASNGFMGWVNSMQRFTATSSTAKLNFLSRNVGGNASYGNLVSDVSVGAVPEPANWAMMITGFGLVGHAMRRRNRRVAAAGQRVAVVVS